MKRDSLIQRRTSTSSRCMSAICPAGPPKLSQPIRAQTRVAFAKDGLAGASNSAPAVTWRYVTSLWPGRAGAQAWSETLRAWQSGVGAIQAIEHPGHRCQHAIIILVLCSSARQDGRDTRGFRHGYPSGIQVVNQCPELGERGVLVQAEAREQDFKRDLCPDVRELRAVEIKAARVLRTAATAFEPGKFRLLIDEPTNQPRRTYAIDPQVLTCCPQAALVFCAIP